MKIGAQLYTVRDFCQNAEDLKKTFERVRSIGYEYAQLSAWGQDITPAEIKAAANSAGLKIALTHFNPAKVLNETDAAIEFHKTIGAGYIGLGSMPGEYSHDVDGVNKFAADFTRASEKIRGAGLMFMYHNHAFEFEKFGGKNILFRIAEGVPSCGFVLDTFWAAFAGADPCEILEKLEGRADTVHFKDMKVVGGEWAGKQRMCEVGEGNLNWVKIFAACEKARVRYAFVEQDDCFGRDPFDCLKTSFDNLRKMGVA